MKFIIFLFCLSIGLVAQDLQESSKKSKQGKQSRSKNTLPIKDEMVIFRSRDLGEIWSLSQDKKTLVYSPDSTRQTDTYKKYIFSFPEFRKFGGDTKSNLDLHIHYRISKTESQNYTPSDPSMPAPSGGFTYINHYCKIIKISMK